MNPYGVNHTPLKRARLPVPPLSHYAGLLPDCLDIISDFARLVNPFFNLFILFEKEFLPPCRETRYSLKRCAAGGDPKLCVIKNSAGRIGHTRHIPQKSTVKPRRKTHKINFLRRRSYFESKRGKSRRAVRQRLHAVKSAFGKSLVLFAAFAQAAELIRNIFNVVRQDKVRVFRSRFLISPKLFFADEKYGAITFGTLSDLQQILLKFFRLLYMK